MGSDTGSGVPSAPKATYRIIEYPRLSTNTAPIGTIGRNRANERARIDAPPMQTRSANAVEPSGRCGPDQSGFDTDGDRDDHAEDEHRVWLRISDAEVVTYR